MGLGRLLLSVTVLCLLSHATAKLQYALSTPAQLSSGKTGRVCVNLVGSSEPLDVVTVLEHNGQNTSIIAQNAASSEYFQCNEFPIPKVTESVPAVIIFSATGKNTDLRERKTVVIKPTSNNCMFQMDKPIYKPGDKVSFRIICLSPQLKPVNEKYKVVYLQDPSRARLAQWVNQESDHGVVSMDFQLISDAVPGSYIITAERESGSPLSQWLTVKEYVAPRFEVNVKSPDTISVTTKELKVEVSAMYTFGEPVAGDVTIRYCKQPEFYGRRQNCFKDRGRFCSNMTGELGPDGSFSGVIDMFQPSMRAAGRGMSMNLDITVIETGTGIQTSDSRYVYVTSQPANLQFDYESMNRYYKRGMNYSVVALLKDELSQPMANEELQLDINNMISSQKATTGPDGQAVFEIDTSNMVEGNFTLKVSYQNPEQCFYSEWSEADYPSIEYTVFRFYSKSGSFLQLKRPKEELSCGKTHNMEVEYIINPAGVDDGAAKVTFYNMLMSNAIIVQNGQKEVDLTIASNGVLSFGVTVSADLSPSADLVVYAILKDELIADTIKLSTEKCFRNQVSMTFTEERGLPGANVEVQLSGDPNSLCGLRVLDSSLLLLNPYESFTAEAVFNSLRTWFYGYYVDGFNVEDPEPQCEDPDKIVFYDGRYYLPVSDPSEGDTYSKLKEIGLIVGTGATVRKPVVCDKNPPPIQTPLPMAKEAAPGRGGGFGGAVHSLAMDVGSAGSAAPVETVRTNMAETFMWIFSSLNSEGHSTISEKAPDSITKWQGSAFCMSDEGGFGMTRYPANYTTYLPFFVELNLPYSCIRGETLVVIAIVRNFLEECVKVQVTMKESDAYDAVLKDGVQDACVCSNDRAAYTYEVNFKKVGEISLTVTAETTHISQTCDGANDATQPPRKDTVVQSMIVEPEGVLKELTLSNLVMAQSKTTEIPVSITPPDNVVPDSPSAFVTAVGDILGLSIQNLQDLLKMPYGCAEQNLVRMAPIPYVVDYLNSTGQLTDEILKKAISYMSEGYSRQLSYSSGPAYKFFRSALIPSNSLTVYTFATFEKCKPYIFIDETRQQQTLIWLENTQRLDNGCFKSSGNVFQSEDVDDDLHYNAYVAISLLETDYSLSKTLLDGAMQCLRNASNFEQKISDQIMMLYAFTLAKDWEHRAPLLEKLMKRAVSEGGTLHWEREQMAKRPGVPFFAPRFPSYEVSMTAYMLLSIAAGPSVTQEDLTTMAQMSVWLGRQQNSNGGLASTQDTVVALKALAAFAKLVYVPNAKQDVVIRRGNSEVGKFDLNQENRLVVHRKPLDDVSGDYSIGVTGTGWSLIQTTVRYNIPVPKEDSAFALAMTTSSDSCLNGVAFGFTINISLSYQGQKEEAGMTIIQIRMLSGYSPDFGSMNKLVSDKVISKAEQNARGHVILYLDTVKKDPIHISFKALMGQRVLNVKSSSAYVYSYYDEDENGYATYNHPCDKTLVSNDNINKMNKEKKEKDEKDEKDEKHKPSKQKVETIHVKGKSVKG